MFSNTTTSYPDSKVPGASMGRIWGQQDPGGPHVGPMKFAIWVYMFHTTDLPESGLIWVKDSSYVSCRVDIAICY